MSHRSYLLIAAVVLVGVSAYGACIAITEDESAVGGVTIDPGSPPDEPPTMRHDAGAAAGEEPSRPAWPPGQDPPAMQGEQGFDCAGTRCLAGETCCFSTGECVPVGCADCCPTQLERDTSIAPPSATGTRIGPDDDLEPPRPGSGGGPEPPFPD